MTNYGFPCRAHWPPFPPWNPWFGHPRVIWSGTDCGMWGWGIPNTGGQWVMPVERWFQTGFPAWGGPARALGR